jgi:exopolysaccharide biosynthesis polyprenyl glycosylphosphotransferase
MKKLLIILADLLIVYGSIFLSYNIWGENLLLYEVNINAFYIVAPIIGILYLTLMYAFGLYNSSRRKIGDMLYTVFLISVSLMFGIMATCFFVREGAMAFPRSIILLSTVFYWITLTLWRLLVWKMERSSHGVKTVTVVGPNAEELASVLYLKYKDIYRIKYIRNEGDKDMLSSIKESEMIYLSSGVTSSGRDKILLAAAEQNTDVCFVPEYRDLAIMSASMQKTDDIPTYYITKMGLTAEECFVKRIVDLLLGSIGFFIALPIGLIVAFLVKLDGGSVFYRQERLTRDGKIFKVIKFRTMVPDAEKMSGPVFAGENDPRITKVGQVIRAMRLDEIPQILNILIGDMSIVGPRPERPFFIQQFEKGIPQYRQRLKVKAGLTGLAQVEGKYNTTVENKLRYDLLYISNYSLFQDILIILQTVKILFLKESTEGIVSVEKESRESRSFHKEFPVYPYSAPALPKQLYQK